MSSNNNLQWWSVYVVLTVCSRCLKLNKSKPAHTKAIFFKQKEVEGWSHGPRCGPPEESSRARAMYRVHSSSESQGEEETAAWESRTKAAGKTQIMFLSHYNFDFKNRCHVDSRVHCKHCVWESAVGVTQTWTWLTVHSVVVCFPAVVSDDLCCSES